MTFRRYTDADYEALCDFLIALNEERREHINWNWARFEWMAEHPDFDKSRQGSIGLWLDGGRIVGAAIYDMYFGEAFCGALPDCETLYPEILDYAYRALRDESGLAVAICCGNEKELAAAKEAGFVPIEQSETVMRAELAELPAAALPEGFSFVSLDPAKEGCREIQWLFWRGFDHGEDPVEFEADYERTMRLDRKERAHFDPYLSVAAAAPDGEKVAYCCLWYRKGTDYAYVEPVCTVPAYRGRGLGGAVVAEALRRAKEKGAQRAYVISDLAFYEKLGFERDRQFGFWRKA